MTVSFSTLLAICSTASTSSSIGSTTSSSLGSSSSSSQPHAGMGLMMPVNTALEQQSVQLEAQLLRALIRCADQEHGEDVYCGIAACSTAAVPLSTCTAP